MINLPSSLPNEVPFIDPKEFHTLQRLKSNLMGFLRVILSSRLYLRGNK